MTTYTRPWNDGYVVERVAGRRPEAAEHGGWRALRARWAERQLSFFIPDVANSMAYTHGRDGERASYEVVGGDRETARLVAESLLTERPGPRYTGPLDQSLHDWMRELWRDTVVRGRAVHEIAPVLPDRSLEGRLSEEDPSKEQATAGSGFVLFRLDPRDVRPRWGRWGGGLVQHVSKVDQQDHDLERTVRVSGERFGVFELPSPLREQVREAVAGLSGEDMGGASLSVAPWSRPDLYALGYTLDGHLRARDAVMARATRATGYHARSQFDRRITGHYLVRRQIREARFREALRQAFLDYLNEILARQAERLGVAVRIEATNTFSDDAFDAAEAMLDAGTGSFRDIMSRVRG